MKEVIMHSGEFITLAVTVLLSSQSVSADCTFTDQYDGSLCIGNYTCYNTIGDLASEIRHWNCRQHTFSFSGYRRTQTNDYVLNIHIEDLETSSVLTSILEYAGHIITMSIQNSLSISIPYGFFDLSKLTSLDVSHNNISMLDLSRIHFLEKLYLFNASFNLISVLQGEDYNLVPSLSTVDLSHNAISVIPDNYFKKYPNLLHLDMSHNEIKSFSILTFEGVAELETLHLSNNKIEKIGMYFARFQNLKELSLDHNELTSVEEISFKMMSKLIKLNLSFNKIISIDETCFQNMISLEKLHLNVNMIQKVSKSMFINNNKLQALDLSGNNITGIESDSFKGKFITQLALHNNSITGLLDKSILVGVSADTLDFSINSINSLGPDLFTESHLKLRTLNFSTNSISIIHDNTFRSLGFLTCLDLSNNKIKSLHFDFNDLRSLAIFKAGNNLIEKVTKDTFRNLKSLNIIDLTNNRISEIETFSFKDFEHLQVLNLANNDLSSTIAANTFSGLSSTSHLNLTQSKIDTIEDGAFYGMTDLIHLNMSYSDLHVLSYNAFNNTGSIWTLDLSHNGLKTFLVNNSDVKNLLDLYLNNNQISKITNETFAELNLLESINLNNNNILQIASGAFNGLHSLNDLILSSNVDMELDSLIFSNLSLTKVSIHNVWKPFNFGNANNALIFDLDLSSCNITNVGAIQLARVARVEKLILNSNKIPIIDKHSFQNLSNLVFLDLSDNLISFVKPGSFASSTEVEVLNLSNNNLQSLQFGVLDGLAKLRVLNLSSNSLHTFNGNLFHNSHMISVISLDNNMIDAIDLNEIASAGIPKISIGNNILSCDYLAKSKKDNFQGVIVSAEIKELHSENIDGISCIGVRLDENQRNQSSKKLGSTQMIPYSGNLNSQVVLSGLGDLKSVLYFESACLLIIVVLLVALASFVYLKMRSRLARSYSLNSRKHLTGSTVEMEL